MNTMYDVVMKMEQLLGVEDLLRMEGEYNLMNGMVNEMKAGAWANLSGEDVSRKVM